VADDTAGAVPGREGSVSRGLGRVQRAIVELLTANPHAAYSFRTIAAHAFPDTPIEKKHLSAVSRALCRLTDTHQMPEHRTWYVRGRDRWVVFNRASSVSRMRLLEHRLDGGEAFTHAEALSVLPQTMESVDEYLEKHEAAIAALKVSISNETTLTTAE
jgi:hypothetical protein